MKWLNLIKETSRRLISNTKSRPKLLKIGQKIEWYIEYDSNKVGELVDAKYEDMFWVKYKIICYEGHEQLVLDYKNWNKCKFQFKNKNLLEYAENPFCGDKIYQEENYNTISMRALYVTPVSYTHLTLPTILRV